MKILKVLLAVLLFLSAIFFAYSFVMVQMDKTYRIVYQWGKYIFIFLFIVYIVFYFVSTYNEPVIKKKEIVTEFDTDPLRQQSFPAAFSDKNNNKDHVKRDN